VYRAKSCTSVFLAGKFLFVPSDTFAVVCIVQPQNAPKKELKKTRTWVFWDRHRRVRSVIHWLCELL